MQCECGHAQITTRIPSFGVTGRYANPSSICVYYLMMEISCRTVQLDKAGNGWKWLYFATNSAQNVIVSNMVYMIPTVEHLCVFNSTTAKTPYETHVCTLFSDGIHVVLFRNDVCVPIGQETPGAGL